MMQGMMESSAWRATLTALRAFVATAEPPPPLSLWSLIFNPLYTKGSRDWLPP